MGDNHFFSLDGPLDSTPAGRQMRVANLAGLPSLVKSRGGDPRAMLERHEIDPQLIRVPYHFSELPKAEFRHRNPRLSARCRYAPKNPEALHR